MWGPLLPTIELLEYIIADNKLFLTSCSDRKNRVLHRRSRKVGKNGSRIRKRKLSHKSIEHLFIWPRLTKR